MPDSNNSLETILESVKLTEEQEKAIGQWYADRLSQLRDEVSEEVKTKLDSEYDSKLQESLEFATKEMKESLTESLTEQLTDEITECVLDEMEQVYGEKFHEVTSSLNRVYENKLIAMLNGLKKELREQVETEFRESGEYQAFLLIKEAITPFVDADGQSYELKKSLAQLQNENVALKKENTLGKVNETILRLTSKINDDKVRGYVKESLESCKTVEEVLDNFDKQLKLAQGLKQIAESKISESLSKEKKLVTESELSYEEYKLLQEAKKIQPEAKAVPKQPLVVEAQEPITKVTPTSVELSERNSGQDGKVIDFRNKMRKLAGAS